MLAQGQAVVAGEDDNGMLPFTASLELFEHTAQVMVEIADARIVIGQLTTCIRGGARPWSKCLIPDLHFAVIKRMDREKSHWQGNCVFVVLVAEGFGADSWIMRYRRR